MNKKDLIVAAAQKAGISQRETEAVLDVILEVITETVQKEEPVMLLGFGSFTVQKRAARVGYNPSTKEKMQIPSKRAVKFKAGAKLELKQK